MTWGLIDADVTFGARPALASMHLDVEPSQVTVVVGGDGAGKSTSLRALVGLVSVNRGSVRRPAKEEIGYVPALAGLYLDLTVTENLRFSARSFHLREPSLSARVGDVLARVGLTRASDRLGSELSGGMQRKLAVAMALIHTPPLLVLDEPTTGVDPVSRADLWELIAGAAADGAAVVVATTYVREAERGSRAVLLEAGHVLARGAPSDIVSAVRGSVGTVRTSVAPSPLSWRRGVEWRVWSPEGPLPEGVEPVEPDIEDAAVIAALAGAQEGSRP